MDNFIQITVFCPPEPRIGAFVYRNAGKVYCPKLEGLILQVIALHFFFSYRTCQWNAFRLVTFLCMQFRIVYFFSLTRQRITSFPLDGS